MRRLKKVERDRLTFGYCTVSIDGKMRKRAYPSKAAAKRGAKSANAGFARRSGPDHLRGVYLCHCGMWHTTSRAQH